MKGERGDSGAPGAPVSEARQLYCDSDAMHLNMKSDQDAL